jgi:molybdate transport system ATP-binding protein
MLSVQIEKQFSKPGTPAFRLQLQEELAPGFTVLFGPSGAGKSTLLDCIAGLIKPDSGRIQLGAQILYDSSKDIFSTPQEREMGYVFQTLALFPHMSVEENVAYGVSRLPAAERPKQMERILETFHIAQLRGRKPLELSGGERQRVALARSVITNPRVLLLDEPLTGLDGGLRAAILEDLRNWNTEHRIPILYVTHNREEVDAIAERVVTMVDGRVRETGNPRDVLDAPRSLELAQASGFENLLTGKVVEHRPEDGVMRVELSGSESELEVPLGAAKTGQTIQVAIRAGDILLATELPFGLSARNILPGTIQSMETRGTIVNVQVNAGAKFTVHVTPGAARSLELAVGSVVWLVIKTHSCHVVTPRFGPSATMETV